MNAPRRLPEKQEQNHRHQNDAFGQVVQHRMGGVVQQIAAVEVRNDLHAGRQDVLVQLLHLVVDGLQRRVRIRALAQQHDAFHHVVVVDDLAVLPMNRLPDLAQPDSAVPACTVAISLTRIGVPFCALDHGLFDVAGHS